MTNRHIIYISDFSMGGADSAEKAIARSGYSNIGMELCKRLAAIGYDVKVLGIGYTGQEYNENFSIIPCSTLQDVGGTMNNLKYIWGVDVVICALDINFFQEQIFPAAQQLGLKYICITPLESDPLCITWSAMLSKMDKVFFISQFGTDEAIKAGVSAEHIEIGIDTVSWRVRTEEEYSKIRTTLGFSKEDFVVLTVADNQERKNLGHGFQIVKGLKDAGVPVKYILVTRENSMVGWKLYDLAYSTNLSSELRVFQSGMPFQDLYMLYCAADALLLPSKGEGLGLPVMEAMSVGVPVVATQTGAIPELLGNNERGWVVPFDYWYYDPFGNQKRYFISVPKAVESMMEVIAQNQDGKIVDKLLKARQFMEAKNWDKPAEQIHKAIEGMFGEGL